MDAAFDLISVYFIASHSLIMAAAASASSSPPLRARRVLALGQFISLLIALTGVFTQTLSQSFHIQVPVTQSAGNYLLLSAYLAAPALRLWRDRSYSLEVRRSGCKW